MVGISYGSDDREARLSVMPLKLMLRDMVDVASLSVDVGAGGSSDVESSTSASTDGRPRPTDMGRQCLTPTSPLAVLREMGVAIG
jgi:hypothetical protein